MWCLSIFVVRADDALVPTELSLERQNHGGIGFELIRSRGLLLNGVRQLPQSLRILVTILPPFGDECTELRCCFRHLLSR